MYTWEKCKVVKFNRAKNMIRTSLKSKWTKLCRINELQVLFKGKHSLKSVFLGKIEDPWDFATCLTSISNTFQRKGHIKEKKNRQCDCLLLRNRRVKETMCVCDREPLCAHLWAHAQQAWVTCWSCLVTLWRGFWIPMFSFPPTEICLWTWIYV